MLIRFLLKRSDTRLHVQFFSQTILRTESCFRSDYLIADRASSEKMQVRSVQRPVGPGRPMIKPISHCNAPSAAPAMARLDRRHTIARAISTPPKPKVRSTLQ